MRDDQLRWLVRGRRRRKQRREHLARTDGHGRSGQDTLGTVLVDSHGRTLYELTVDSTQHIVCVGVCASLWPPDTLPAGAKPVAGGGVEATLATVQRPDGTWQVAVDGHPLYTYRGDDAAGQTKGQGVMDTGGTWYALSTSGTPLTSGATAMTSSSSSSSSGSAGYAHY